MPNLSAFIRTNLEPILIEWEVFARALPGTEPMDIVALRDHAREMLQVIASDLETPQTRLEQSDKAQGRSDAGDRRVPAPLPSPTPAQEHGSGRADSGFSISQMVAEFRALRASVIHLWTTQREQTTVADLQDMIRFNEGIDQAIAESITTYTRDVTATRDRFLAILGHDLRTPLGAIITASSFMREVPPPLVEPHLGMVGRIEQSARRMNEMVTDLLDFTRTRFGDSIPVVAADMDLEAVIGDVASEVRASNPSVDLQVATEGDLRGHWDRARLAQALINLLSNAVHHGDATRPITLHATRTDEEILILVHNEGKAIPAEEMDRLFDPMKESGRGNVEDRQHLGLGLYIVDQVVRSHAGAIEVQSSVADGTTFTMRLPTNAPKAAHLNRSSPPQSEPGPTRSKQLPSR
jgi:signal transduction histidine kinase